MLDSPLQSRLLGWFAANKRDLPWRQTEDPYAIWVSEAMLQQTQVATVIPYYHRFLERFPTLWALAEASIDDVLALWAGLGYYSRARNLHAAARRIVAEYGGEFPSDEKRLRALPGVGSYTVGAILSIAFGRPVPAIDGNVDRVLCRLYGIAGAPRRAPARGIIEICARGLVDCSDPGGMTQALMELGATVCTPTSPDCPACPVSAHCSALAEGTQSRYPQLPPRAATVCRTTAAAIIRREQSVLVAQRPETGVWAGLWEFPQAEVDGEGRDELTRVVRDRLGLQISVGEPVARIDHGIMNQRIRLTAYECEVTGGSLQVTGYQEARWVSPGQLATLALSSPHRKIAEHLAGERGGSGD